MFGGISVEERMDGRKTEEMQRRKRGEGKLGIVKDKEESR